MGKVLSGFLDTKGKYYPCPRYGHVSMASKLVEKFDSKLRKKDKYEFCEDVLLKNGWICIRSSDVYKAIYDHEGKVLFISDEQMKFFQNHKEEFNQYQLANIEMLVRDFGLLRKLHEKG